MTRVMRKHLRSQPTPGGVALAVAGDWFVMRVDSSSGTSHDLGQASAAILCKHIVKSETSPMVLLNLRPASFDEELCPPPTVRSILVLTNQQDPPSRSSSTNLQTFSTALTLSPLPWFWYGTDQTCPKEISVKTSPSQHN